MSSRCLRAASAPVLIAALLALAACQAAPPVVPTAFPAGGFTVATAPRGTGRLAVTPLYRAGVARQLLAAVTPKTLASISHMEIKIYSLAGAVETLEGTADVQAADLLNTITFGNLENGVTYRIRAFAYETGDTSQKISLDASSFVDLVVGTDDAPVLGNLVVQLQDVTFSGESTATGVAITPGGLSYPTAVGIVVNLPTGVTTLAGASLGFVEGTGGVAAFEGPTDVALGPDGNLYVADTLNHSIRRVTPGGVVTTFAGNGTPGAANGLGAVARFNAPEGIAVDAAGWVYVGDTGNHKVRKISPAGNVEDFIGTGSPDLINGTGGSVALDSPRGIAVDPANGDVYVADTGNHCIRRAAAASATVTFAGNGAPGTADATGTAATFTDPTDVALATNGDLYVTDRANHTIRKLTPSAVVTTYAGTTGFTGTTNATGGAARFNLPTGIATDPATGDLIVSDFGSNRIRRIATGAVVTTVAGSTGGFTDAADLSNAKFDGPSGLAADEDGVVFVADRYNHRVRRVVNP